MLPRYSKAFTCSISFPFISNFALFFFSLFSSPLSSFHSFSPFSFTFSPTFLSYLPHFGLKDRCHLQNPGLPIYLASPIEYLSSCPLWPSSLLHLVPVRVKLVKVCILGDLQFTLNGSVSFPSWITWHSYFWYSSLQYVHFVYCQCLPHDSLLRESGAFSEFIKVSYRMVCHSAFCSTIM